MRGWFARSSTDDRTHGTVQLRGGERRGSLLAVAANPALKEQLGLGPDSRVLLIGSEGATDPEIYKSIVGDLAA